MIPGEIQRYSLGGSWASMDIFSVRASIDVEPLEVPNHLAPRLKKKEAGMGRTISQAEMRVHLQEQIDFIKSSSNAFDHGQEIEAKRIAVHIRTLLHDTRVSHSLFSHLGMKDGDFVDSAYPLDEENFLSHSGLILTHMSSGGPKYVAPLDDHLLPITLKKFEQWWNDPVFVDGAGRRISRKMLILTAANKDGGAHVDAEVEETYDDLARNNSLCRLSFDGNKWKAVPGPERFAIRQIAHEILKTIDKNYTKKIERGEGLMFGIIKFNTVSVEEGRTRGYEQNKRRNSDLGGALPFKKIGRNKPCWCGSGDKFKRCHGQL